LDPPRLSCGQSYLLVLLLSLAIFTLRRPEVVTNAQFWAEDGQVWYRHAYEDGLRALVTPHSGYLQTTSRLVFGVSIYLPLAWVPLFANSIGLLVRGLVVAFLFSGRFSWAGLGPRLTLAIYMLLMPGLAEVHANITNTQWYLAIYLMLVLVADDRTRLWWRVHDFAVLFIAGLSGPFIVFIVPAYMVRLASGHDRGRLGARRRLGELFAPFPLMFFGLAAIQSVLVAITAGAARPSAPLGADILTLAHIVVTRIFVGFMVYPNFATELHQADLLVALVFVIGLGIAGYVLWRGSWQVQAMLVFAVATFAFALASPVISRTHEQSPLFTISGERYFVIPRVAWMATLAAFLALVSRGRLGGHVGIVIAVAVGAGCLPAFRIADLPDEKFPAQVAAFESSPPGTRMTFSILPPGWIMTLVKR
jgi:hypothetical protein